MKSPVFKALLAKRRKVEKTKKDKVRNRKTKEAKNEHRKDTEDWIDAV